MVLRHSYFTAVGFIVFLASLFGLGLPSDLYGEKTESPDVIYVYPGGPMVGQFRATEQALGLEVKPLPTEKIEKQETNLPACRLIVILGIRELSNKENFQKFFSAVKKEQPQVRIVTSEQGFGFLRANTPELTGSGIIEKDGEIEKYSNFSAMSHENMRRLMVYFAVTYLGRTEKIVPPEKYENRWFYHPDYAGTFTSLDEFFQWSTRRGKNLDSPRALIETNIGHILWMNQKVIDALIREFEKHEMLAVAMNTIEEPYEQHLRNFKPDVLMILTGKSGNVKFYMDLGVPRLQPMFLMGESIEQWQRSETVQSMGGGMMLVNRESLGIIEPRIVAGQLVAGKDFTKPNIPIPERLQRFVARAISYVRLARKDNQDKKIAIQYLGPPDKGEMMLGTPDTAMAESLAILLKQMKKAGYTLNKLPQGQEELISWMIDHGHQILSSAPAELDKLVRSRKAVLLPMETYRRWFEEKLPVAQQEAVIKEWGKIPGKFMVWQDEQRKPYLVIPKIDLGHVVLVPAQFPEIEDSLDQKVREALLERLKKDPYGVVPSHNQLAANFWIEDGFKADALVVWEFLVMDYCLPRRTVGLRSSDWPDILMGNMPNIRPWPICELHWSLPARRRTCAVLVDHLTAPDVSAGLADELLNISNDIIKWDSLPEGALQERFRTSITQQVREARLDRDMHLDLRNRQLTPEEIRRVAGYLNDIYHEKINVSHHVLGQPPCGDALLAYIVTCLRGRFLDGLSEVIAVPPEQERLQGHRKKYLQQKAQEVVGLVFNRNLSPSEAIAAVCGKVAAQELPEKVKEGFDTARYLYDGLAKTHLELDNLLLAMNGRFVPPGPGNLPERNPAVVPTGRNMYIMNPEEIPSRASWDLGKQLVDQLLAEKIKTDGRYPEKIGLSLDFRSTMMDYGVLESQILYLIGTRPLWDASNRVLDIEVIPAKELGRPRIDVFIETYDYYADYLESRLRLWDKAIRKVCTLEEPDNYLFKNRTRVRQELQADGLPPERVEILSQARIFAMAPEQVSFAHFLLLEETGKWDARRELVDIYLAERDYAYTEGNWGKKVPEAYRRHLQGTELVMRTITRGGPLTGAWYNGGNLCLVIKELTGKEPDYFISDLRNPGEEKIECAEDLLQKDLRATIFNRYWLEQMMKEDYAGAQQMAGRVFSTLGWKINRESSISDDVWQEIVEVYLRDRKNLRIREWFDSKNPYAFQGITENLLEAIRKEYWRPDETTVLEVATAYAQSIVRYGHRENGELNEKLEIFLARTLNAPGTDGKAGKDARALLGQYRQKTAEEMAHAHAAEKTEIVAGRKIEPTSGETTREAEPRESHVRDARIIPMWPFILAALVLSLFLVGLLRRMGAPR